MLKWLFKRIQAVLNHLQKAKCWSCSFQQRHPRRLGCDYLSNSFRPWRGVVTVHTLVEVEHPRWTVVIQLRRHGHTLLRRNTVTLRSVTCGSQHRNPVTLHGVFHEEPSRMLSRGRQNTRGHIWQIPKISRKFAGEWRFGLWRYGQDENHTWYPLALVQLFLFFKAFDTHFSREAKEREALYLVHTLLSPFLCMKMNTAVCHSFGALPEYQDTL